MNEETRKATVKLIVDELQKMAVADPDAAVLVLDSILSSLDADAFIDVLGKLRAIARR